MQETCSVNRHFFQDIFLCMTTMPLTLIDVVDKRWLLGDNEILCKLVHASGATSVFVSTITITTIAVDRYQVD